MVKAVQKASDTLDQKLRSSSPFLKLMGRRVMELINPATAWLKTTDAILFQAHQSKRDLMGIAAMAAASYAIYDIQRLRGDLGEVTHQQHAIEAYLRSAAREMRDLHLAAAKTRTALQSVLKNDTDMEQPIQVQILAQTMTVLQRDDGGPGSSPPPQTQPKLGAGGLTQSRLQGLQRARSNSKADPSY